MLLCVAALKPCLRGPVFATQGSLIHRFSRETSKSCMVSCDCRSFELVLVKPLEFLWLPELGKDRKKPKDEQTLKEDMMC